jgi:hypothetical protein
MPFVGNEDIRKFMMDSLAITALKSSDHQNCFFSGTIDAFAPAATDYVHLPTTAGTGILFLAPNKKHLSGYSQRACILIQ